MESVRKWFPAASITTDIIVGFCGETEEEFEETLSVVTACQFDSAFMFNYSVRPGTFAAEHMPDDVSESVKKERLTRLIDLQQAQSAAINRHLPVLVSIGLDREVYTGFVLQPLDASFKVRSRHTFLSWSQL